MRVSLSAWVLYYRKLDATICLSLLVYTRCLAGVCYEEKCEVVNRFFHRAILSFESYIYAPLENCDKWKRV